MHARARDRGREEKEERGTKPYGDRVGAGRVGGEEGSDESDHLPTRSMISSGTPRLMHPLQNHSLSSWERGSGGLIPAMHCMW